jgi:hypothetical protein
MKKPNSLFTAIGLLLFFLLCLVPTGQAQQSSILAQTPGQSYQIGLTWTPWLSSSVASSNAFGVLGIHYFTVSWVPSGTVSGCTVTVDGNPGSGIFTTGSLVASQTCTSAGSFTTTSPVNSFQAKLTPTITGSGSVIFSVTGYDLNPAASGSIAGSVAVTGPVDGGGNVKVNCITGCASANPNGQATMANSAPVTIASNQSSLPVNAQPLGFGTLIGFQQAVTASAVALSSNASHSFCVQALPANTTNVYVGPSGVTTSTGLPLQPGQVACWTLTNTNLVFVIASTTGASVAVSGV